MQFSIWNQRASFSYANNLPYLVTTDDFKVTSYPLHDLLSIMYVTGIRSFAILFMVSTIFTVQQSEQMKEKDKRIKLMSEILNGIKVLKLYAWEESFTKIISGIRKEELTLLRRAGFTNAASSFFWQLAPFMVRF